MTTDIEKQRKLGEFVNREVCVNQSMLVYEALRDGRFDFEDIKNHRRTDKELKDDGYKTKKEREEVRDNSEDLKEVFEWWVVSDWLLDKLEAKGEPVLRSDYGDWWGRTTTGQAIKMDWIIEQVFDDCA